MAPVEIPTMCADAGAGSRPLWRKNRSTALVSETSRLTVFAENGQPLSDPGVPAKLNATNKASGTSLRTASASLRGNRDEKLP
mmetsp:Transcript_82965/g.231480  ORF Transcript_82965/g.231480 Transcript_82965/m.231480 type:complete len:83 (-) Transcript_82965:1328-1576(-)